MKHCSTVLDGDPFEFRVRGRLPAIDQHMQPRAEFVSFAGLVPHDADAMTAIRDIVESEVVPIRWRERIHFQRLIIARSQPDQSRDDQIAEARMEIVLGVVVAVVSLERAGVGMQGLCEIRLAVLAMRARVDLQQLEVVGLRRRGVTP